MRKTVIGSIVAVRDFLPFDFGGYRGILNLEYPDSFIRAEETICSNRRLVCRGQMYKSAGYIEWGWLKLRRWGLLDESVVWQDDFVQVGLINHCDEE